MTLFTRMFAAFFYAGLALLGLAYCLGLTAVLGLTSPTPF